jgi:cytochrome P450
VLGLVAAKEERPGDDLPSRLLDHPAGLTVEEVAWQVFLALGTGHGPTADLLSGTLSRILGDPEHRSTLTSGAGPVTDAVTEVLRHETPLANHGIHYARRAVPFHGTLIEPAVPVVISYGALGHFAGRDGAGTGRVPRDASHLSWSAGPHACPAKQHTLLVVTEAVERLTQWLPDLEPVLPRERLSWRPGPFHRSLAALPVRFTPRSPDRRQPGESA